MLARTPEHLRHEPPAQSTDLGSAITSAVVALRSGYAREIEGSRGLAAPFGSIDGGAPRGSRPETRAARAPDDGSPNSVDGGGAANDGDRADFRAGHGSRDAVKGNQRTAAVCRSGDPDRDGGGRENDRRATGLCPASACAACHLNATCPVPRLKDPHRRPGTVLLVAAVLAVMSIAWSALAKHAPLTMEAYAERTMTAPVPAGQLVQREPD